MEDGHEHVIERGTSLLVCVRIVDENLEGIDISESASTLKITDVYSQTTSCNLV